MGEIKITLETLYDILRNEKKRADLQKLEDTFFVDVVMYLREKQAMLDSTVSKSNPLAMGEKEKLEYELRSIKRILKQTYELREKKVIEIALNRSRTGSDIIDTSSMLRVERDFYQAILKTLDAYRRGILLQLFKADLPDIAAEQVSSSTPPSLFEERKQEEKRQEEKKVGEQKKPLAAAESPLTKFAPPQPSDKNSLAKIKFIHPVPSFIWKDMKEYGPFDSGDETSIYTEVADLLVRKGRATKV